MSKSDVQRTIAPVTEVTKSDRSRREPETKRLYEVEGSQVSVGQAKPLSDDFVPTYQSDLSSMR